MKSESSTITIIAIISVLVLICCLCLCMMGFGAFTYLAISADDPTLVNITGATATPALDLFRPTPVNGQLTPLAPTATPIDLNPVATNTPGPEATATPTPVPVILSTETLFTLQNALVPENNPRDLAQRLLGITDIPETVAPPAVPYQIGDQQTFWASNTDSAESFEVDTTLRYITPHTYWWIENGTSYNENDLRDLAETFENDIYPTDREFFGSEWTPGIDGDEHLYIVFASDLGFSLAGYFSSADEVHPLAHEYSNAHEMFFMNTDNVDMGDEFTYGVLAHEIAHRAGPDGSASHREAIEAIMSHAIASLLR